MHSTNEVSGATYTPISIRPVVIVNPYAILQLKGYTPKQIKKLNKAISIDKGQVALSLYDHHDKYLELFESRDNILKAMTNRSSGIPLKSLDILSNTYLESIKKEFNIRDIAMMLHVAGHDILEALFNFLSFNTKNQKEGKSFLKTTSIVYIINYKSQPAAAKRLALAKKILEENPLSIKERDVISKVTENKGQSISTEECNNILDYKKAPITRTHKKNTIQSFWTSRVDSRISDLDIQHINRISPEQVTSSCREFIESNPYKRRRSITPSEEIALEGLMELGRR